MCGIFGAIGAKYNRGIIRSLALINRERGTDSLGFFDSTGNIVKDSGDPLDLLSEDRFHVYLGQPGRWFVAGHTRFATFGAVKRKNSHPFKFGRYVGSHNGQVAIPVDRRYRVDSQYLFDELNRHNGDYQTAFASVSGYWALSWFDGEAFYLQAHRNTVTIGQANHGVWYYSSEAPHLLAACGPLAAVLTLAAGQTIRFTRDSAEYQPMPIFQSTLAAPRPLPVARRDYSASGCKVATASPVARATWGPFAETPFYQNYEDKVYDALYPDEAEYADSLAQQAGYGGLVDFMAMEGLNSVDHAVNFLEDTVHSVNSEAWEDDGSLENVRLY